MCRYHFLVLILLLAHINQIKKLLYVLRSWLTQFYEPKYKKIQYHLVSSLIRQIFLILLQLSLCIWASCKLMNTWIQYGHIWNLIMKFKCTYFHYPEWIMLLNSTSLNDWCSSLDRLVRNNDLVRLQRDKWMTNSYFNLNWESDFYSHSWLHS